MKKISVITINLNNREGLETTIKSVVGQTCFDDIEYIVIDGGSTDGSVDVIREYERFIKQWVSEKDGGIYNAMNKGLQMASGEYTIFLNSGDWFHSPDAIEAMIPLLDKDIVYGDLRIHRENGRCFTKKYMSEISYYYFTWEALPHEAAFVRTSLYKTIRFREDYRVLSDSIFFHEAINLRGASYKHVKFIVTDFCLGGISSNEFLLKEERLRYFGKG